MSQQQMQAPRFLRPPFSSPAVVVVVAAAAAAAFEPGKWLKVSRLVLFVGLVSVVVGLVGFAVAVLQASEVVEKFQSQGQQRHGKEGVRVSSGVDQALGLCTVLLRHEQSPSTAVAVHSWTH